MDFIKISYTGRIKDGGVFDTTDRSVAEKEGIFDKNRVYQPLSVVVGSGQLVKGLDESLKGMNVGVGKKVEVKPEDGYGSRSPEMVRLIPMKFFKQQKINPIPGMPVEIDGMPGRVQTVAGGRVRVDFNSELAGKTLVFDVKVEAKASSESDKVSFLLERSFGSASEVKTSLSAKKLMVKLPEEVQRDRNLLARKASFTADCFKHLGLSEVTFEESWKNPESSEKPVKKK
ncbi:MAG: peptidylprolyl isomerase [Candidatus Altiarchaeota archaeon]